MTADVPVDFRRGRESGSLDNCNDHTTHLWKLLEWRKHLFFSVMMRDEVPFAPSVQTWTCEVNIHQNITEIQPLTTDNEQFENVNLSQTTSVAVQCHVEDGSRSVGCKSLSTGTTDSRRHDPTTDSGHRRDINTSIKTA